MYGLEWRQGLGSFELNNEQPDSIILGKFIEEVRNH
jgi:hypothetical protein